MKKLTLHLDALRVESFETGAAARAGTVNGHALVAIVETDDPRGCMRSIGCLQAPVAIVETDDPRGCMRSAYDCAVAVGPAPSDPVFVA